MIVYLDGENIVHQLIDAGRNIGMVKTRAEILECDLRAMLQKLMN